jgi:hypothetical protein
VPPGKESLATDVPNGALASSPPCQKNCHRCGNGPFAALSGIQVTKHGGVSLTTLRNGIYIVVVLLPPPQPYTTVFFFSRDTTRLLKQGPRIALINPRGLCWSLMLSRYMLICFSPLRDYRFYLCPPTPRGRRRRARVPWLSMPLQCPMMNMGSHSY